MPIKTVTYVQRIEKQVSLSCSYKPSTLTNKWEPEVWRCDEFWSSWPKLDNVRVNYSHYWKKNWSEVWLRGFITHEPRYPWCDIIISTKPSPRSLILVCSINWRISQWMYLMMKKTKIPVCRPDETYIYCIGLQQYHRVAHFVKCVTKAIYGQLVEPATCQMD